MKPVNFLFSIFGVLSLASCSDSASSSFTILGSASAAGSSISVVHRTHASITPSGTPTELKIRLYKTYLSANADCTSPTLLKDYGTAGEEFDFVGSPTLFTGSLAAGTSCPALQRRSSLSVL